MRYIRKVSTAPLIEGRVTNTVNVTDKETNAPSLALMQSLIEEATKIERVTVFTATEGFAIAEQRMYKQGNHYFGDVVVRKTNGTFSTGTQYTAANLNLQGKTLATSDRNTYCALSTSQWSIQSIGYAYISSYELYIKADNSNAYSYAKIKVDLVVK